MYIKYLRILLPFKEFCNNEHFLDFQILDSQIEYFFYNSIIWVPIYYENSFSCWIHDWASGKRNVFLQLCIIHLNH